MAMSKNVPTGYGIDANYWKISFVRYNFLTNRVDVTMCGWITKPLNVNVNPILQIPVGFDVREDGLPYTRKELYNKLKLEECFQDSEDV